MNLACQFQHLLAEPISILPAPERAQPPEIAGSAVGAGFQIPTTEQLAKTVPGCSQGDADAKALASTVNKALMRKPRGRTSIEAHADRDTAGNTLPVPVLAEPYHIEDACERLNRMTDGEARESTHSKREPVAGPTLAAGNSFCAGGEWARSALPPLAKRGEVPARTNLAQASVQLPECEYLETICDAIELADQPDDFRVIRAAINKVRGVVNRQSLRMMVELREKEVAI